MKKHCSLIIHHSSLIIALALLATACNNGNSPLGGTPALKTQADTLSWALGENTAQSLLSGDLFDLNNDIYLAAIRHTLDGKKQPISDTDYNDAMQYIMYLAQIKQAASAQQIDQAEEQFFAQLPQSNPNAKQHKAGFWYEELTPGKGPKAAYAQFVNFDYRSFYLLSGQPYDQTYGKRGPINTVVGAPMFPALIEALQLMNAGSKYRFYFTSKQTEPIGGIPPHTPLIYEIELHTIGIK